MTMEKETLNQAAAEKGTLEVVQEGISKTAREIWLAGLGALATVDKEGTKLFNQFVARGREVAEAGKAAKLNGEPAPTFLSEKKDQLAHEVYSGLENAVGFVRRRIDEISKTVPGSSRSEIKTLTEKVEQLSQAVAAFVQKMDESAKTSAKKAA